MLLQCDIGCCVGIQLTTVNDRLVPGGHGGAVVEDHHIRDKLPNIQYMQSTVTLGG